MADSKPPPRQAPPPPQTTDAFRQARQLIRRDGEVMLAAILAGQETNVHEQLQTWPPGALRALDKAIWRLSMLITREGARRRA